MSPIHSLLPLTDWPMAARARITGVFTDIDDTLTRDGAITPDALQALGDLSRAGFTVIPITGRPVGWSEPFARAWPVNAIVAENGAVALRAAPTAPSGQHKLYQQDVAERAHNFTRMQAVLARVLAEVPQARASQDSAGRETDIAIDHSEFHTLTGDEIEKVAALMRDAGMTATVSSIHINGWFGTHDKLAGARWIVRELFKRELDRELDHWVYVGDSTNDQLMFEHFPHSVGVANIRRFENQLDHLPHYITPSEQGSGFAEVAQALLEAQARR